MKPLAIAAIVTVCWLFAPPAFADDIIDCNKMDALVADNNATAPYMVDQVTRVEPAVRDCQARVAGFNWTILSPSDGLVQNWRDVMRTKFEQGFCADQEYATVVRNGWQITVTWTTEDNVVYSAVVACM